MNKILIIGKNSRIVKSIFKQSMNITMVSHSELFNLDFKSFKTIIIFSWSYKDNKDNINLAKKLPIDKVIFISSHSVLALNLRKQISKYPEEKKHLEDFYLKKGGSVVRIANTESNILQSNSGTFAFTDKNKLANYLIENHENIKKKKLVNFFEIKINQKNYLVESLYFMSLWFDKIFVLKILIFSFIKFVLKNPKNNYTADCNSFFYEKIQVGYGAIGPEVKKKINPDVIFVSPFKDKILNKGGFRNLYIGYNSNGLAKYWHGVRTCFDPFNKSYIIKKTAFFVPRSRLAYFQKKIHVLRLIKHSDFYELVCTDKGKKVSFFAIQIHLAAGWLENTRLASSLKNITLNFTDDENAYIGTVETKEMIAKNLCKKIGPFVFLARNRFFTQSDIQFFVEPRPYSKKNNINFYKKTTTNLLFKLIQRFDVALINEAIYNKFGFAFYTKKMNLFAQILLKNNILVVAERSEIKKLIRKRITNLTWNKIRILLKSTFNSISFAKKIATTDGIHVQASQYLIMPDNTRKNIFIYGPPKNVRSNCLHTTYDMKKQISGNL